MRVREALPCVVVLVWLSSALPARADELVLTPAGLEEAERIERAIAPVPLDATEDGRRTFHGVVVEATPGDPDEPPTSVEGNPTYTIVPYAAGGEEVGAPVRLSALHVQPVQLHMDALLDLRTYASNRDRLLGTYLGSPAYIRSLLRALDPQGVHGLGASGGSGGDGEGLEEGGFVLRLKTRVEDSPDFVVRWQQRVWLPGIRDRQAKRLPLLTDPNQFFLVRETGQPLLDAIARAEKYLLYENGFAQAAMSILGARSELIRATGEGWYADALREDGQGVVGMLLLNVQAAAPGNANPPDTQPALPLDPSDRAKTALDVLLLSDGPFFLDPDRAFGVVDILAQLGKDPAPDDPRAEDEHDLRAEAKQVLARLVQPGGSEDARVQQARRDAAPRFQQALQDEALTLEADLRRFSFDALSLTGWRATDETLEQVETQCGLAIGTAGEIDRVGEQREEYLATLDRRIALLRDLAALASADRDAERRIGRVVVAYVERVRGGEMAGDASRHFLAAWERGGDGR